MSSSVVLSAAIPSQRAKARVSSASSCAGVGQLNRRVKNASSSHSVKLSARAALADGTGVSVAALLAPPWTRRRGRSSAIFANLGGQYGDTFGDVDKVLVSYFTFRALKETLAQIQETDCSPNKTEYKWLYKFASENNPNDSQAFIKALFAVRQDYGSRILTQRQELFDRWQDAFMPKSVHEIIEKENLEHLRSHLTSTVNLADDCLFLDDPRECLSDDEKIELEDGTAATE